MKEFPSGRLERGALFARAGLKVGGNYARYYAQRALSGKDGEARQSQLHHENARDIFAEFSRLRGTALKLAQSLSMDTGLLPDEFAEVMASAQYRAPPLNRALVRASVKRELGKYPEQVFQRFDLEALAAASIGQVHRAELPDGRQAAVKVQYPHVRETIRSDLSLARTLFRRVVRADSLDEYFDEVGDKLLEETDYLNEGQQIESFARALQGEPVVVPELVPELTTRRLLTMTFVEGMHLDAFLASGPSRDEVNRNGQLLWDFVHRQIAGGRYAVYADVHPGNFLFRADGRLGVVDFGCVKTFPPEFLDGCLLGLAAHLEDDGETLLELLYETELLDRGAAGSEHARYMADFYGQLAQIVFRPYEVDGFDFGDPEFKGRLNARFKEATRFDEVRGSRHFIFVNRVLIGLYSLLMKMKAVVDTRESRRIVAAAAGRIREKRRR